MTAFPYPVRCFNCHPVTMEDPALYLEQMKKVIHICGWAGEITGETGIPGLRIDFNAGLRLQVPAGNWHIRISDYDTEMVFFDEPLAETILISMENYYIHWQIEICDNGRLVFSHLFDPDGQTVMLAAGDDCALGDALAFLPYVKVFQEKYATARVCLHLPPYLQGIARRFYPQIPLRDRVPDDSYATFFFNTGLDNLLTLPIDGRQVPLQDVGRVTLGLYHPAPRLVWKAEPRQIREPYVCIGVQASSPIKGWFYPEGWDIVIRYLKELGYRVLCIDRDAAMTDKGLTVTRPETAEDFTGNHPLTERADMLAHADFFIGLPSGLAWLADIVGCPVVMIGGFSFYWYEFPDAYHVYNPFSCYGCMNDIRDNYFKNFCGRHWNTPRALECSRTISPRQVIRAIDQLMSDQKARLRLPSH